MEAALRDRLETVATKFKMKKGDLMRRALENYLDDLERDGGLHLKLQEKPARYGKK